MANKPISNKLTGKIDEVIRLYKGGMLGRELAKMFGTSQAAISYHIRKRGLKTRWNVFNEKAKQRSKENHARGESHWAFHNIPINTLIEEYLSGVSTVVLAAKYEVSAKTIQLKLKENGVLMRRKGFGTWQTAKDGHSVQSYYELLVDDWLFDHGVQHINQPKLPFGRNTRSDFLAGDTYIEVMGLISSPIYKERYAKKLDLYKKHGLKVVCIFPSHFRNNLEILSKHFGFAF